MRVSVIKADPGYSNFLKHRFGKLRCFLDGVEIDRVVTADEEQGMVVVQKLSEVGRPYIDKETNEIAAEVKTGIVRLERING